MSENILDEIQKFSAALQVADNALVLGLAKANPKFSSFPGTLWSLVTMLDGINFRLQSSGVSQGRLPDGRERIGIDPIS